MPQLIAPTFTNNKTRKDKLNTNYIVLYFYSLNIYFNFDSSLGTRILDCIFLINGTVYSTVESHPGLLQVICLVVLRSTLKYKLLRNIDYQILTTETKIQIKQSLSFYLLYQSYTYKYF